MHTFDMLLVQYGLLAIFILMLTKSVGVPVPIPADLIILTTAVGAAAGKFVLWQAFSAILVAVVLGGIVQFLLARGPGRGLLYRFGRYIGLTQPRLDAAAAKVKKGGVASISIAILVPGVRAAAVASSGLANIPMRTFIPGLIIGSSLFLGVHFFLGYTGGSLLAILATLLPVSSHLLSTTVIIALVIALFVVVYILWLAASRRQRMAHIATEGESLEVWHEGVCPVCLALYAANRLRTPSIGIEQPL